MPAIFLNPILFLMSVNTILSRVLPPVLVEASVQPPPYSTFGPSAEHPHLDVHASDGLCWGYTLFIVCAQLVAFGRVSERREEQKRIDMEERNQDLLVRRDKTKSSVTVSDGWKRKEMLSVKQRDASSDLEDYSSCAEYAESELDSRHTEGSGRSTETTDSEGVQ